MPSASIVSSIARLLAAALARFPATTPLADRVADLLAGPLAERDVLFRFYSRERLMSERARAEWVEPDLSPVGLEW